jgi:glycerol-3-phosphate acyltransferase PlsY
METILWALIGFFSGALPFSVIAGYLAGRVDIRNFGDRNPGSTNVLRAVGLRWAIPAFLLDYLKGAIPVSIVYLLRHDSGWSLAPIALAPILGHAFSPFLLGRGGKAVAVTFGVWTALTLGAGPTTLGLLLGLSFTVLNHSAWALILAFTLFGGFIIPYYAPGQPVFALIWLGNLIILAFKHRQDLSSTPRLRRIIKRSDHRA